MLMPDNPRTTPTGFDYLIREDGINVFRLSDLRRESVDAFFEANLKLGTEAILAGRHARSLIDVSTLVMPTPYAIKKFQELVTKRPSGGRSSVAILTPAGPAYTFGRTILSRISTSHKAHLQLFNSEEAAFGWLDERLQELGS